jgi:hypothetical protein
VTAYRQAINQAWLEVEAGRYELRELEKLVNQSEIIQKAMNLINQ